MMINIKVLGQQLIVCQPDSLNKFNNLIAGTQKFIKFKFELDDSWQDLIIFAQFTQNNNSFDVYLDENNCVYLPGEIQQGKCSLILYGVKEEIIAISDCLSFKIKKNCLNNNSNNIEITESLYNQLVNKIDNFITELKAHTEEIVINYLNNELTNNLDNYDFTNHIYIGSEEPSENSDVWIWIDTSEDTPQSEVEE